MTMAVDATLCMLALVVVAATATQPCLALDNGLALRPPMGWLAWERFVCDTDCKLYPSECIDESLFLDMASRLVADGYHKLGYDYVNIDDCWSSKQRDPQTGRLVPEPARFPRSVGYLASQLHAQGLKLGIYGDCGTQTCQLYPGQLRFEGNLTDNYFALDAQTFAEWGVDSFKFDGCNLNVTVAADICPLMQGALNATQRPMLFSCSWPAYENDAKIATNWELVVEKCNLWRAFGDIEDSWRSVLETIDFFVAKQDLVVKYHGPGHWFDADQLVIGDFGLSHDQEQAHMAVWCIWASPLYMSNDLRSISKDSRKILQNKWAIEVNQDPLGVFGLMVLQSHSGEFQAFVKPLSDTSNSESSCPSSYAIVYLNRRTLGNSHWFTYKLRDLIASLHHKLSSPGLWPQWAHCAERNVTFNAYDIFNNFAKLDGQLGLQTGELSLRVNLSGVRMIKLIQSNST